MCVQVQRSHQTVFEPEGNALEPGGDVRWGQSVGHLSDLLGDWFVDLPVVVYIIHLWMWSFWLSKSQTQTFPFDSVHFQLWVWWARSLYAYVCMQSVGMYLKLETTIRYKRSTLDLVRAQFLTCIVGSCIMYTGAAYFTTVFEPPTSLQFVCSYRRGQRRHFFARAIEAEEKSFQRERSRRWRGGRAREESKCCRRTERCWGCCDVVKWEWMPWCNQHMKTRNQSVSIVLSYSPFNLYLCSCQHLQIRIVS